MKRTKFAAVGLVALSLFGATAALAENHGNTANDAAEMQAFMGAKVTLADAVLKAEAATGGKVMSIDFSAGDQKEAAAYDTEIMMADGTVAEYQVNPVDGSVQKAIESAEDEGNGGEENGQDGENGENGENGEGN